MFGQLSASFLRSGGATPAFKQIWLGSPNWSRVLNSSFKAANGLCNLSGATRKMSHFHAWVRISPHQSRAPWPKSREICVQKPSASSRSLSNAKRRVEQLSWNRLNGGGGISFEHEPALNCVNKSLNQASTALKNSRCEQQQVGFSFFGTVSVDFFLFGFIFDEEEVLRGIRTVSAIRSGWTCGGRS